MKTKTKTGNQLEGHSLTITGLEARDSGTQILHPPNKNKQTNK